MGEEFKQRPRIGFGAGERMLFQIEVLEFNPGSAHNGFLSAWLSAGWVAAWVVACVFVGTAFDAARRSYRDRAYMLSLIVFLTINNLTYPLMGSYFNVGTFVMMVLACAGPVPKTTRSKKNEDLSYSPWKPLGQTGGLPPVRVSSLSFPRGTGRWSHPCSLCASEEERGGK